MFATAFSNGVLRVTNFRDGKSLTSAKASTQCIADSLSFGLRPANGATPARGALMAYCRHGAVIVARVDTIGSDDRSELFFKAYVHSLPKVVRPALSQSNDDVRPVQHALAAKGIDPGKLDGVLGPVTSDALAKFRDSLGANITESDAIDALVGARWRTTAAALSPLGDLFAVAGADGVIRVVVLPENEDTAPSEVQSFDVTGHADVVTRLAISADGQRLASSGIDGRLWITDLAGLRRRAGAPLYNLPSGPGYADMSAMALRPSAPSGAPGVDDYLVVYGSDRTQEAANDEIARAKRAGLTNVGLYRQGEWFVSVARFRSETDQTEGLKQLKTLSRHSATAYVARLSQWCPSRAPDGDVTRCLAPIARPQAPPSSPGALPLNYKQGLENK